MLHENEGIAHILFAQNVTQKIKIDDAATMTCDCGYVADHSGWILAKIPDTLWITAQLGPQYSLQWIGNESGAKSG